MSFRPFEDNTASFAIGDLTFENNDERVSMYGSMNIGRDQQGLAQAKKLQAIINDMVAYLEEQDLPEQVEIFSAKMVRNPFLDNDEN
ncbi:hypothetical protein ACF3NA_09700 [Alkanindiges sp. WGS2144]|uniref:hypothetical protein n=1 Tax=Alkanindiges sp. WGS2144 TaxID=3366808 RepID=UPI003750A473